MRCQTPRSTPAACTRTNTSSAPITGLSVCSSRSTASASPYLFWTIAFIVCESTIWVRIAGGERAVREAEETAGTAHMILAQPPRVDARRGTVVAVDVDD